MLAILALAHLFGNSLQTPNWNRLELGNGFSVELPGPPISVNEHLPPEPKHVRVWVCMDRDGRPYSALIGTLAGADWEVFAAGAVNGLVEGDYNCLLDEREFTVRGWPAARASRRVGDKNIEAQFLLKVKDTIMVLDGPLNGPTDGEEFDHLVSSLRIPDSVGIGPLKDPLPLFAEYPVGTSGITARFPHRPDRIQPIGPAKDLRYGTFFTDRDFGVDYVDLLESDPKPADITDADISGGCKSVASSLGGTIVDQKTIRLGSRTARLCRFTQEHGKGGNFVFVVTNKQIAYAYAEGPMIFADSKEFLEFVQSLNMPE